MIWMRFEIFAGAHLILDHLIFSGQTAPGMDVAGGGKGGVINNDNVIRSAAPATALLCARSMTAAHRMSARFAFGKFSVS